MEEGLHTGNDGIDEFADGQEMAGDQFHVSPESEITDVAVIELHPVKDKTSYDHTQRLIMIPSIEYRRFRHFPHETDFGQRRHVLDVGVDAERGFGISDEEDG